MKIILTEDEKRRILGLHGSNLIMEQGNPKVTQIQTYLKGKGYDLGTSGLKKDGIDGQWGNKTLMAVKSEFGIELDNQGNVKTKETPNVSGQNTTTTPEEKLPTNKVTNVTPTNQQAQLQGVQSTPPVADVKTFGKF